MNFLRPMTPAITGPVPTGVDDLHGDENDAQRDDCLDRPRRNAHEAQGRRGQGDAVGQGEGGHRPEKTQRQKMQLSHKSAPVSLL